ncbi:MAG: c-type cytochrome [Azonexus sp.]|jgi:cytochrome c|nr:c-type cytochrome [Azonexus sp.]
MRQKPDVGHAAWGFLAALLWLLPGAVAAQGFQVCDNFGMVRAAEMAVEHGCFGCHTLNSKRVGPPYKEVAAKYSREPITVEKLAGKIRQGGSGVWGSAEMPPNKVSDEEAETLARWVLSLMPNPVVAKGR